MIRHLAIIAKDVKSVGLPSLTRIKKIMNIRHATPEDANALARLHVDSWRSAYRGLIADSHLDSLEHKRCAQCFRESLLHNAEETYLAEYDGKVFGFLTLGASRDADVDQDTTGEIWGIYTLESPQNMGHLPVIS